MHFLLFALYLVFFCWWIPRLSFFKNSGIERRILVGLFLARIAAGAANVYINEVYYKGLTDVANFHLQGIVEYHLLFHHPVEYFTNMFQSNYAHPYGAFLESSNSFWNNLRNNLIIKLMSIFDIFSAVNIYINALLYNFLIFFGSVGLYRVFIRVFPNSRTILLISIFLLPSTIYYSSSMHRDGLIYLSLSMVIYYIYFLLRDGTRVGPRIAGAVTFMIMILLLRSFVLITMVPALLGWFASRKKPGYTPVIFGAIYFGFAALFFATSYLPAAYNLPAHVSSRQIDFIITARRSLSSLNMNPIYPNVRSFFNNIPQALNHSFMRPYLTEATNPLVLLSAIEVVVYEALLLLFIFFRKKHFQIEPIVYFSVFLILSMFLVIGYTIPILGAIARYRSIYFPLLFIPVLCFTDWERVRNILYIK